MNTLPPLRSLSPTTLQLVKKTLPVFQAHSHDLALALYHHLFSNHPSLKTLFSLDFLSPKPSSPTSQISAQARILSDSIITFCASLPDLTNFAPHLNRICCKHVSRHVTPAHYGAVAAAFVAAADKCLSNKLSKEELQAWEESIKALAALLIHREKQLYESLESTPGAWLGFREFSVKGLSQNACTGSTVTLSPADKRPLADYISGQYVCLRANTDAHGPVVRNISLAPRMVVKESKLCTYTLMLPPFKAEENGDICADRVVQEYLQNGENVELSAPTGGFVSGEKGAFMKKAARAKEVGLRRVVALRGARSPLAEVVESQNMIEDGAARGTGKGSIKRGALGLR